MNVNICRICLHTEKKLKTSFSLLTQYHDELSDFIVDTEEPLFCIECEHQLKKHYNFRNKCRRAAMILQEWEQNNSVDGKTPLESLHNLLLCKSRLDFSKAENTKVILSSHNENKEPIPTLLISQGLILNTSSRENNKTDMIYDSTQQTNNVITNTVATRNQTKGRNCKDITYTKLTPVYNKKDQQNGTEINTHDDIDVDDPTEFDDSRVNINSDDNNDTNDLINPKTVMAVSLDHNYVKNVNIPSRKRNRIALEEEPISTKDDGQSDNLKMKRITIDKEQAEINEEKKKMNKISPKEKARKEQINYLIVHEPTVKKPSFKTVVKKTIMKDKLTFDVERLKADLTIKFASCGDLVASDGTAIDKDYILDCLYRKIRESTMKSMWSMIRGKSKFTAKIIQMLAFIQKKHKGLDKYADVFDIEYLITMDKLKEEFEKRKHYEVFLKAEYKCLICFQKCVSEKHLEKHAIYHEESSGEIVCEVCRYRLPTMERLKHHFLVHHHAVFKCKLCPYVTYKVENVDVHWSKHKNMIVICDICKKTAASRSTLRKHIRLYHSTTESKVICNQCGNAYYPQWFAKHLLKFHGIHGGVNPPIEGPGVPCDICDVTFPSQSVYEDHINRVRHGVLDYVSGEQRPWKRKTRGPNKPKTIDNNKPHREGKRFLGNNWEWTCPVCSAEGKTWGKLKVHFEFEHPDVDMSTVYESTTTHLCEICGRGLSTISSLRDHMRMHTGERPFQCDLCQKRYTRRIALQEHRLSHFPKSKQCPHCGKLFLQENNLNNHLRIHVNDRRYKCKVCNKGFLHRCALTQHFNSVHLHIRRAKKKSARKAQPVDESQIIEEVIYLEDDLFAHSSE